MSKVTNPIHLVINTYYRRHTITHEHREKLYRYIWRFLEDRHCHLYRIGGIPNHIHILFDLHASVALSDIVRDLKKETNKWMKETGFFPSFEKWGKEYYGFGVSRTAVPYVVEYIKNQGEHHRRKTFDEELKILFEQSGLQWDDAHLS